MKMSVTTLCVLLVMASYAQYGSATLHEFAVFMPHTRVLRQVSQSEVKRCSNVFLQALCSTTSYAQDIISLIGRCGQISQASTLFGLEGVCRKNPSTGDYCGSLVLDNGNALVAIPQSCTISSCSTSCRTQLNSVINNVGCCATSSTAINLILSPYIQKYKCNLTLPTACPASSLRIPSPSYRSCTPLEVRFLINNFRCSRSNVQPILSALNSANCGDFASAVEADCSYRNGQYCYEHFIHFHSLTSAVSQCSSSSSCSSGCRTEISTINNDLGCCINYLNASLRIDTSNALASYRTITSNELWNACGETPPGECEVRLSAAASLCGSMSAILLLAFTVVMLIKF